MGLFEVFAQAFLFNKSTGFLDARRPHIQSGRFSRFDIGIQKQSFCLEFFMDTKSLSPSYDHISPAGAEVRSEMSNRLGSVAHCTLTAEKTSKAVAHKTVSEFWHVLSGKGEIWRRHASEEQITELEPGTTID